MPVTSSSSSSSKATLDAQSGKVPASSGKIAFAVAFGAPPVLVLTTELAAGAAESARVSILSINTTQATFRVDPPTAASMVHWTASEPT
jgi:hypothetical protein